MTPRKPLDWLAVQLACDGHRMPLRFPDERRAVVRFYEHRMLNVGDNQVDLAPGVVTARDVARLIGTTARSVQRIRGNMPRAVKRTCPQCGEPMWRCDDGTVELHPNRWNETCQYVGSVAAVAS